jgi:hypothetical protein
MLFFGSSRKDTVAITERIMSQIARDRRGSLAINEAMPQKPVDTHREDRGEHWSKSGASAPVAGADDFGAVFNLANHRGERRADAGSWGGLDVSVSARCGAHGFGLPAPARG